MLTGEKFTVGYLADASPTSLILPRAKYEETILVGHVDGNQTAVFLSGQHRFRCFAGAENNTWKGLIISDVQIEVDETSLFDPAAEDTPFGSIIRTDARLAIQARQDSFFGNGTLVTLHSGLPPARELRVGFANWHIVVGQQNSKRVVWSADKLTINGS